METLATPDQLTPARLEYRGQLFTVVTSRYANRNIALRLVDAITEAVIECTIDVPALELLEDECLIPQSRQDLMQTLINARLIVPTDLIPVYTRRGHRARVCQVYKCS
ncbi:MAG: hypothetical protein NW224_12960 [Leptolyngbyaceae cyanobacterium bins.302]|nr:hypothetical protein [Leptolyngbyaceae cyanobacterium bins.302]